MKTNKLKGSFIDLFIFFINSEVDQLKCMQKSCDLMPQLLRRWSKIARFLPGRTDNEIKNYWRTRVQKHAKQLRCDAGSRAFKDGMRRLWMQAASTSAGLLGYPCTPATVTGTTMANSASISEEYYFSPAPPQQLSSLGSVIGLEEEIAGGIDAVLGGGDEWTERQADCPGSTYVGGDWPWTGDCLWSESFN